jgi:homoserine dehydrogenase
MAENRRVPIILLGLGNVGRALLRQILDTPGGLTQRAGTRLVPIGLADTTGLLFDPNALSEDTLHTALQTKTDGRSLRTLAESQALADLDSALRSSVILVDVTASTETEPLLCAALKNGPRDVHQCSVVLANKHPLSGPWDKAGFFLNHPRLRYEATVGAGLPVIATLRYLLATGDRITAIEGCFSGTLGYLCAQLERGEPYATAVAQARALGYTEPDPREDLSGRDVARKALILARTVRVSSAESSGWALDMSDLAVEALYPDSLADVSAEAFMDSASTLNRTYADRFDAAQAKGHTLRYVARISPEGSEVGLTSVPQDSPLGALRGPANYVAFHTERYSDVPLVISGPGAGPEVTAAGVLGDIIGLARETQNVKARN